MNRKLFGCLNQKCKICSEKNFKFITNLTGKQFKNIASIYQCKKCTLGITIPKPNSNYEYYTKITQDLKDDIKEEKTLNYIYKNMVSLFDDIYKKNQKLKILDFGCGRGDLIRNFKLKYPYADIYGVEASKINEKFLEKYKIKIFNSIDDLIKSEKALNTFDIISSSSVLEHIENFEEILKIQLKLKRKEGYLLISQAIYDAFLPKILPFAWYGWQPHEHFYHFSENSLKKLAKNKKLKIVKYQKASLHQSFCRGKNIKIKLAQIIIFIISKIGKYLGKGDLHNLVLK